MLQPFTPQVGSMPIRVVFSVWEPAVVRSRGVRRIKMQLFTCLAVAFDPLAFVQTFVPRDGRVSSVPPSHMNSLLHSIKEPGNRAE